ncbi:hypothetical protein SAMN05216571_101269 [Onishia taeanensis]|uniref:Uncharacterized protein n=1 Tax=Onishia taeanensis TaxID=284577 RepID=A0A1G7N771_9GAMM|nr:hypothetical protein [Halomonas taeanensis]SDF69928.1 hypothetical protein SAMN05216571_101269 [Halomonas taeanensis]
MRNWIAALALLPAVAWGQSDCYSVTLWEAFAEMSATAEKAKQNGMDERQLMNTFSDSPSPIRAAWHEAVRQYYSGSPMNPSGVIASMQTACAREDYANMPR